MKSFTIGMLMTLCLISVGCVTSEQFKLAASIAGPIIASHATVYAAGDKTKIAQVTTFGNDTSVKEDISSTTVAADWNVIKLWYEAGAAAETDPLEKKVRSDTATKFDALVTAELARPFRWFGK